jgi:hypothetical protein
MAERELILRFRLEDSDLVSPSDFVDFFGIGVDIVRDLVIAEALEAYDAGEMPSELQRDTTDRLQQLLRSSPVPALVDEVRHDSPWLYILHIPAFMIGAFVTKCLKPDIARAWKGSAAQESFYSFFRIKVFGGAKKTVQRSVATSRRRSRKTGIRALSVEELPDSKPDSTRLLIRVQRSQSVDVAVSDEDLVREFKKHLRE